MKKSKAILLALCAVLLVAASVMGTLAYLTSTDTVVNTFTVGKVAIKLDEAKVNLSGQKLNKDLEVAKEGDELAERVKTNDYHLLPGHTYSKDPMVTVIEGSESSYIRMLVTISNATGLKEVFGDDFLPQNYVSGWNSTVWPCVSMVTDETANTITCEFRYHITVAAPDNDKDVDESVALDALFDSITVPGTVTNAQLAKLAGLKITVVAQAIQADGFTTADAAWNAFEDQNP